MQHARTHARTDARVVQKFPSFRFFTKACPRLGASRLFAFLPRTTSRRGRAIDLKDDMVKIIDRYKNGYALGSEHAQRGVRRRAQWELAVTSPITWVPGVDQDSFFRGYEEGYRDTLHAMKIRPLGHP